jgi:GxxExxY protein
MNSHEDTKARGEKESHSRGGAEMRRDLDEVTGVIIDASIKLHQALGPGLLESVYEVILSRDLERRGLRVERQKLIRFEYDGLVFEDGLRLDILVDGIVVVELKSVESLAPVHKKQLLTYLRLMNLPVGLLLNFGAPTLKEGLHRVVNNLSPSASPRLRVNQSSPHV